MRDLLAAAPGWDGPTADAACSRIAAICGTGPDPDRPVSWLLNPKADTARVIAFSDATQPGATGRPDDDEHVQAAAWPGFPFTPAPEGSRA